MSFCLFLIESTTMVYTIVIIRTIITNINTAGFFFCHDPGKGSKLRYLLDLPAEKLA